MTLNDPAFVECASALANRMEKEGGDSLAQKINYAYYLGLNKNISVEKSEILENLYHQTLTEFNNESMSYENEASDLAMAMVANSILNLDEMLNK